jgi:hypothetical protein
MTWAMSQYKLSMNKRQKTSKGHFLVDHENAQGLMTIVLVAFMLRATQTGCSLISQNQAGVMSITHHRIHHTWMA